MIEAAIAIPILIALLFAGFALMQMTMNSNLIERNLELAARAGALAANVAQGTILEKKSAIDHAASVEVAKLNSLNLHPTSVTTTEVHTSSVTCAIVVEVQFTSTCSACDMFGIFTGSSAKTFSAVAGPSECLS